ncbi:MAG TPA: uracil-DNA glycosylase, partial [Rhodothermia bacterium]
RDIQRLLADQAAIHGPFLPLPEDMPVSSLPPTARSDELEPPFDRILALLPEDSPLRPLTTLDQVADYVARTILLPIDLDRTNPVPGVGNPNANLMVIGEAPGADEDRIGEPFVGRAGQLLDKILLAIHFTREDVYIANVLKSRPPGNRDPQPEEVAAHLPILLRQITLVKPKLILCVGRIAGNYLLGTNTTLKALRETRFHDFHGIPLKVTYHPAALLRSEQYKKPTWEDVQDLRARYDELVARAIARPN